MRKTNGIILVSIIALLSITITILVFPALAIATPQTATGSEASYTYIVQPGDSLQSISIRTGSSIQSIIDANGIQNPDYIWPAQALVIPAAPQPEGALSSVAGSQPEGGIGTPSAPRPEPTSSAATSEDRPIPVNAVMNQRETAMLEGLNAQRAAAGLPKLAFEPSLLPVARARSNDMANRNYFSHTTPEGAKVQDFVRAAGLDAQVGEILARNNYPPERSVEVSITAFMKSDNHRPHVLGPMYVAAAVGEARALNGMQYYTVILERGVE